MEMKNVPAVMKDAANVLDNFALPNGCGNTLFDILVLFLCCCHGNAASPFNSINQAC